jgi:AcrR family transcriptional regulator
MIRFENGAGRMYMIEAGRKMPDRHNRIESELMGAKKKNGRSPSNGTRTYDPEKTKHDIIAVATAEFAEKGLSGARIDRIAARTKTSKRGIYYYFGGKEKLYISVLEEAYRNIRSIENELRLDHLSPEEALRTLVGFTFDYQSTNTDFVRLVMNENIHYGRYLARSSAIQKLNVTAIDSVRRVLQRGAEAGIFRAGLDPVDVHMTISALCFFNVSNRYTFSRIFKRDLHSPEALRARRDSIIETVLAAVRADGRGQRGDPA